MTDEKKCPCEAMVKAQGDIREHRNKLHEGDITMTQIKMKLENIETKVDKLEVKIDKKFDDFSKDIEELKMKPGERWDGLVTIIITAFVAGLIGLAFGMLRG